MTNKIILLPGPKKVAIDPSTLSGPIEISKFFDTWTVYYFVHGRRLSATYGSSGDAEAVFGILLDAWAESSESTIEDRTDLDSEVVVSVTEGGGAGPVWLHTPDGKLTLSSLITGVRPPTDPDFPNVKLYMINGKWRLIEVDNLERGVALADSIKAVLCAASSLPIVDFEFKN